MTTQQLTLASAAAEVSPPPAAATPTPTTEEKILQGATMPPEERKKLFDGLAPEEKATWRYFFAGWPTHPEDPNFEKLEALWPLCWRRGARQAANLLERLATLEEKKKKVEAAKATPGSPRWDSVLLTLAREFQDLEREGQEIRFEIAECAIALDAEEERRKTFGKQPIKPAVITKNPAEEIEILHAREEAAHVYRAWARDCGPPLPDPRPKLEKAEQLAISLGQNALARPIAGTWPRLAALRSGWLRLLIDRPEDAKNHRILDWLEEKAGGQRLSEQRKVALARRLAPAEDNPLIRRTLDRLLDERIHFLTRELQSAQADAAEQPGRPKWPRLEKAKKGHWLLEAIAAYPQCQGLWALAEQEETRARLKAIAWQHHYRLLKKSEEAEQAAGRARANAELARFIEEPGKGSYVAPAADFAAIAAAYRRDPQNRAIRQKMAKIRKLKGSTWWQMATKFAARTPELADAIADTVLQQRESDALDEYNHAARPDPTIAAALDAGWEPQTRPAAWAYADRERLGHLAKEREEVVVADPDGDDDDDGEELYSTGSTRTTTWDATLWLDAHPDARDLYDFGEE